MGELSPSYGYGNSGPNSDEQGRTGVKEHQPVEECCPPGSLEVLETHSTGEAFCKAFLSHFRFRRCKSQFHIFWYDTPNRTKGSVVWDLINSICTFQTHTRQVCSLTNLNRKKFTFILKYHSSLCSRNVDFLTCCAHHRFPNESLVSMGIALILIQKIPYCRFMQSNLSSCHF